ncbi:MAG: DUF2357 domain-containing protein [Planctomyces sp.]
MSLIVKLARSLGPVLEAVCNHPRKILRRERMLQKLAHVREVDSGCLRWLARQPGASVTEKAGSRQECMAIVRVEHTDTLENRVLRDVLIRSNHACVRYLRDHCQARAHSRVAAVATFRKLINRLQVHSEIAGVSALSAVPEPNYVLQMDPRYREIWQAYQMLVRQDMLKDSVWRWRHRVFAEHLLLGFVSVLGELCCADLTHGGDVIVRREQNAGQFLDSRTALGPWEFGGKPKVSVDLVRGDHISLHPLVPDEFSAAGPDFLLVKRTRTELQRILCIWATLDFPFQNNPDAATFASLHQLMEKQTTSVRVSGILIQPMLDVQDNPADELTPGDSRSTTPLPERCSTFEHSHLLRRLRLTFPLQHHTAEIRKQIQWGLELI